MGLPNGWTIAPLPELVAGDGLISDGDWVESKDQDPDGTVRLVQLADIGDGLWRDRSARFLTPERADALRCTFLQQGDVLIARMPDPLGRSCVFPGDPRRCVTVVDVCIVRPGTTEIDSRWLSHFINTPQTRARILLLQSGSTRGRVSKKNLCTVPIQVPPSAEQGRIVDVLESYLTRLDDAVATLERVQRNLQRYRASVLKAAVEGRLVPTEAELARKEGRSYEPASELLERILAERRRRWEEGELGGFTANDTAPKDDRWKAKYVQPTPPDTSELPDLPEGWCWTRIGTAGRVQLGRQRSPAHHTGTHMRPYLRVANVFEDRIDVSDVMHMNFTDKEFETYRLQFGDILLNEGQSPHLVGRPAMYRDELPGSCFTNSLVRFQAREGVDRRFALVVFLAQLHTRRYMRIAQITTNIAHLGAGRFAEIEFPLPPRSEQARIADEVERVLTTVDATMGTVASNLARLTRWRQSILGWAFEGRLVDQDPSDEPASALLERIRAERDALTSRKKRVGVKRQRVEVIP